MFQMLRNVRSFFIAVGEAIRKAYTVKWRTDNQERIPEFERVRGEPILNIPECVGCGICVTTCPNNALKLVDYDSPNPKNKKKLAPELDLGVCSYCALCVDECPYDAIQMGRNFDRAYLTMEDMHRSPAKMYEDWIEQRGEEEDEDLEVEAKA